MPARVAHPESIVETDWVAQHLDDPSVRLVEVDVDLGSYAEGHIPDAVEWDWTSHLNDPVQRDILSREQMRRLLGECGITPSTSVVLYGDNNNWFATYAFWQLKMYGHRRARIMNGGRQKWIDEGRPMTTEPPQIERRRKYQVGNPDTTLRALRGYVLDVATTRNNVGLVDVRSPAEYRGEVLAPPNLPQEGAQRGGHIPGAANIPWGTAVNEADGTCKSVEELREIYGSRRITHDREIITYCRIGERSSHTWFVLTQILGYEKVRNYDGSWTEYGSIVGAPIER